LRESGFKFYGNEIFYSGYTGEPLKIEVYNGIIHYQRLKHMVNDKFQVSEISPRNSITRQPIKGKKIRRIHKIRRNGTRCFTWSW